MNTTIRPGVTTGAARPTQQARAAAPQSTQQPSDTVSVGTQDPPITGAFASLKEKIKANPDKAKLWGAAGMAVAAGLSSLGGVTGFIAGATFGASAGATAAAYVGANRKATAIATAASAAVFGIAGAIPGFSFLGFLAKAGVGALLGSQAPNLIVNGQYEKSFTEA